MKAKLVLLSVIITILFSCSKDSSNTVLNGVITDCPANNTCTYNYYENADFNSPLQPVAGNYRVFQYKRVNTVLCDATTLIYFKTILNNNDFAITSSQIAAGQSVGYYFICACCDYLGTIKPIGGLIKGKKTGSNQWLVNASIILGNQGKPIDTITVNQYFTLKTR